MPHDPTAGPPPEGGESEPEEVEAEAAMRQEESQALQLEAAAQEGPAAAAAAAPAVAPQSGAAGPAGAAPGRDASVLRQVSHVSEAAARMQAHAEAEEQPPPSSRRRTSMSGIGLALHKRWVVPSAPAARGCASPAACTRCGALCIFPPTYSHLPRCGAPLPCRAGGPAASQAEAP